jgi:small subunit ribosomal protein S6
MPEYELMYLLASSVADDEVSKISEQVKKFITDFGGENIRETQLGKKKLAYPIKKTRNGYYVVVNFAMEKKNINNLEAKIRTQDSTIIRHILLNIDEHLERMEKDRIVQSKIHRKIPVEGEKPGETVSVPAVKEVKKEIKKEVKEVIAEEVKKPAKKKVEMPILDLDQEELDKKIEAALNEDLTK